MEKIINSLDGFLVVSVLDDRISPRTPMGEKFASKVGITLVEGSNIIPVKNLHIVTDDSVICTDPVFKVYGKEMQESYIILKLNKNVFLTKEEAINEAINRENRLINYFTKRICYANNRISDLRVT